MKRLPYLAIAAALLLTAGQASAMGQCDGKVNKLKEMLSEQPNMPAAKRTIALDYLKKAQELQKVGDDSGVCSLMAKAFKALGT